MLVYPWLNVVPTRVFQSTSEFSCTSNICDCHNNRLDCVYRVANPTQTVRAFLFAPLCMLFSLITNKFAQINLRVGARTGRPFHPSRLQSLLSAFHATVHWTRNTLLCSGHSESPPRLPELPMLPRTVAFVQNGLVAVAGYCPTLGITGGYLLGGGLGNA